MEFVDVIKYFGIEIAKKGSGETEIIKGINQSISVF